MGADGESERDRRAGTERRKQDSKVGGETQEREAEAGDR